MARQSGIRASDADRDAVASRLHEAAVDGRLEASEFEERLGAALRARTYGDLDRLVRDLPGRSVARGRNGRNVSSATGTALVLALRLVVALVIVAVLVAALAVTAMWWLIAVVVWLSVRAGRGSCRTRPSRSAWHHQPRAWRV